MKLNEIASVKLTPYSESQIIVYIQTVYNSSFDFIATPTDTLNDLLTKVDGVQSDEEKAALEKDRQIKELNTQLNEASTKIDKEQNKHKQTKEMLNEVGNSLIAKGVTYDYSTELIRDKNIPIGSIVRFRNDFYLTLNEYNIKDGTNPKQKPEYFFKIKQK